MYYLSPYLTYYQSIFFLFYIQPDYIIANQYYQHNEVDIDLCCTCDRHNTYYYYYLLLYVLLLYMCFCSVQYYSTLTNYTCNFDNDLLLKLIFTAALGFVVICQNHCSTLTIMTTSQ